MEHRRTKARIELPSTVRAKLLVLAGVLALAACVALLRQRQSTREADQAAPDPIKRSSAHDTISPELAAKLSEMEARERSASEGVWQLESTAQDYGKIIEEFWDTIRHQTNKLDFAKSFPSSRFILPGFSEPELRTEAYQTWTQVLQHVQFSQQDWTNWISKIVVDGWQLSAIEFRHNRFVPGTNGNLPQSEFHFSAHLLNPKLNRRAEVNGPLTMRWEPAFDGTNSTTIQLVDASRVQMQMRQGDPPLRLCFEANISPQVNAYSFDPMILQDLDGNGISEILLPGKNLFYRREPDGHYSTNQLCRVSPGLISTAVVADFNGDGWADLVVMGDKGLTLYSGSTNTFFSANPVVVWTPPGDVKYPMVLSAGDVDGDGDLDLFLAQYKVPYELGSMPTPFDDARDGHPAYLLINDGTGRFKDGSAQAGLGPKRNRRTYSASLADINGDGHLDLIVVSDFAGIDVYHNDGKGHFSDKTEQAIVNRHAFGMAHAFSDFNSDGRSDILMMGMTSPTASRLNSLGLTRVGDDEPRRRGNMVYGNHLYLGNASGVLEENELSRSISRSGWSWGCTAFDLQNDGYPDVYIGNGLESRESVRDYESEYWLHDLYVGGSAEDSIAYLYFKSKFTRTRGRGQSYGGYEKNRLFLNRSGRHFEEAAHVLGVGLENDTRNVASDDLDGDGRMDLALICFEDWPSPKQNLRLYRNEFPDTGHWIGLRFRQGMGAISPMGATIFLHTTEGTTLHQVVSGDSYRTQHSSSAHFGLGSKTRVLDIEVRWPDGRRRMISNPAVDRYHWLEPTQDRGGTSK